MEFWHVVGDITILLSMAVFLGIIAEKLGLSSVVGYLIAGTLVGPGLLHWVSSGEDAIRSIAEIGVALLLFTIGLEVTGKRLKELLGRGMAIGVLQVLITGVIGYVIAKFLGVPTNASIIIGSMGALSSTAVVSRVLQDRSELDSSHGRLAFGVLLIQDLAIVPLMLLVAFLHESSEASAVVSQLGAASAKVIAFVVVVFLAGILILPRFFGAALIRRSSELPVIVGIVTCLSAMWLADELDLSPAIGAFIAGMILAGSPFAAQVKGDMAPLRYIFLALFFAATGMLADFSWLIDSYHWIWTIGVVGCIVVGKTTVIALLAMAWKHPRRVSIASGLCLAQIGEFSFVIGVEAMDSNLMSDDVFQLMMSSSLLTLLLSPLCIGKSRGIAKRIDNVLGGDTNVGLEGDEVSLQNHVVVIGYGVAGRNVVKDLLETGQQVLVIDMSPIGIKQAKEAGAFALLGNAQMRDVLEHAGIRHAKLVVTTLPDHRAAAQTIHQVRAIAVSVPIVARARYSIYSEQLTIAGADIVVDEEECVGHSLAKQALGQVGL
jgi:CPA2 family monovalent cation:H+ antiporter-2